MSATPAITFGSVCSGIEAASVAWAPLGWRAAWLAEVDPFACAVLAHHYPDVPNLGDMTTIAARVLAGSVPAPDVLCGGTPCQAFSVAGLRRSLADERGNLSLKFVELANAIDHVRARSGKPASVVFWENVPGVLSTGDNAFGCFLAGLAGEDEPLQPPGGRWTNAGAVYGPRRAVAWRVLDAQYFGLAQRRRRVFVVASARGGFDPATVLFEWEGVRRDSAPRRGEGQNASRGAALSVALRGREGGGTAELGGEVQNCLRASGGGGDKPHVLLHADPIARCDTTGEAKRQDWEACNFVAHTLRGEGFDASEDGTGRGTPLVPIAFSCKDYGGDAGPISPTLRSMGHDGSHANAGGQVAVAFNARQDPDHWRDRTGPLDTDGGTQAVATVRAVVQTITSNYGKQCDNSDTALGPNVAITSMQVRRLTPTECARLQGFHDDYLDILYRGKPATDGPKYKAIGNSWAVPVVRWIGERIQEAA